MTFRGRERALVSAALGVVLIASCHNVNGERGAHGREKALKDIMALLEVCPAWFGLLHDDLVGRRRILLICECIDTYDLDDVREAVRRYAEKARRLREGDTARESKLYVLNRYTLDVPERARVSEVRPFGAWQRMPMPRGDPDFWEPLWPLSRDENGRLALTGTSFGYMGGMYPAVQEFDYFREKYGPRRKRGEERNDADSK